MQPYLYVSYLVPMYVPEVDKESPRPSVHPKILEKKMGQKGRIDRRVCCKSHSEVDQMVISRPKSH